MDEALKLDFDFYKHLTTLDTAVLLISIAVLDKFFPDPEWVLSLVVAVVFLLASLYGCLISMANIIHVARDELEPESAEETWGILLATSGFTLGITSLAIFSGVNLL